MVWRMRLSQSGKRPHGRSHSRELIHVPILIVHVSAREAMEQIALAKARGLKVYGETCPQYLFLTADDLDRPGFEGAKYMRSPPPRDQANQDVIWRGLETGVFEVFSIGSRRLPLRLSGRKDEAWPQRAVQKGGKWRPRT